VPKEITNKEEFEKLMEQATEIRIVRSGEDEENAKVKLRTKSALYTLRTTSEDADSLTKGVKTPIIEIGQTK